MSRTWREHAAPIIARVLAEHAGETEAEIRAALREAYPFGVRHYHPYRVWCDEIRRQRGLPSRRGRRRRHESVDAGQLELELFPGGDA